MSVSGLGARFLDSLRSPLQKRSNPYTVDTYGLATPKRPLQTSIIARMFQERGRRPLCLVFTVWRACNLCHVSM